MLLKELTVGVVGGGVVGSATAKSYVEHVREVRVYDNDPLRRTTNDLDEVFESSVVFICLPEAAVDTFADTIPANYQHSAIVLKSTVPVGTTTRLREAHGLVNLVHSPEFLTARCAHLDAQLPTRNIVGGPFCPGRTLLKNIYRERFPGVPVYSCTAEESEAVKLIQNGFFAVKVAFFNEVRAGLCDPHRMNWDRVLEMVLADGRVNPSHTKVPGPDGKYGFGGACLPKDLQQLIDCITCAAPVCSGAKYRNVQDRQREVTG